MLRFLAVAAIAVMAATVGLAQPAGIKHQDVGSPSLAGSYTVAAGKISMVGGGNDIWNSADNFHFAYITVTGDFDYVVKVENLQGPDNWSKAELMAREGTDAGAAGLSFAGEDRHISNMTTRSGGQNEIGLQWRSDSSGTGSAWPNDIGIGTPLQRPTYPNTWLRLERTGSKFWGYASSDGLAWTLLRGSPYDFLALNGTEAALRTAGNLANKLALGLAVTAHNDGDATGATAVFSEFKAFTPVPIAITTQPPATLSVPANSPLTLAIAGKGDPLHYQWRKDGVDIPGAMSATYVKALCQQSDSGSYTVRVYGAGQTAIVSAASAVTVTADVSPPTIEKIRTTDTFNVARVTFTEAVNNAAVTASNYTLTGGLTVSDASFAIVVDDVNNPEDPKNPKNPANRLTVILKTSTQTTGAAYDLTVNANVKDLIGNAISPNTAKIYANTFISGLVTHKRWYGLGHRNFATLLADPANYDSPTATFVRTLVEESDGDLPDQTYMTTLSGFFIPATTGDYVFYMSVDNYGWLYLSTDDSPRNQVMVAAEIGWNGARVWTGPGATTTAGDAANGVASVYRRGVANPADPYGPWIGPFENRSDQFLTSDRAITQNLEGNRPYTDITTWPTVDASGNAKITLTAGKRYSFTLYHSEPEGGQSCATFKLASEADPANAVASRMTGNLIGTLIDPSSLPPVVTNQPVNVDFTLGGTINLSVGVDSAAPPRYQWYRGLTAVPGATNQTLTIANATLAAVGSYYVAVTTMNGTVNSANAFVYTPAPAPPQRIFQQDSAGLLVIEGESFTGSTRASDGHAWVVNSDRSGFSGTGYVQPLGDTGVNVGSALTFTNAARLDFTVNLTKTGTNYFWFRGGEPRAAGDGDSVHAGIDGIPPASLIQLTGAPTFTTIGWNWVGRINGDTRAFAVVTTAGPHTINLWMREDGFYFDKLLITTDPDYVPADVGPAESASTGGAATPTIRVARNAAGSPVITFTGTLQRATSLGTPTSWTDVGSAASPYTPPASTGQEYYRTRQ